MPELFEIVARYKPEIIWSDGAPGSSAYWNSTQFLAWLYNDSPVKDTVVTNDRWGDDAMCKHGGFLTCDDRYTPSHLLTRKWEDCMTIDSSSWGYHRNMAINDILSIETLVSSLASSVSYGGNLLMNIGPTSDGVIVPIFQERLQQMGRWLRINGEGIYGTKPWAHQNDTITPDVWYTCKDSVVYATILNSLSRNFIVLGAPQAADDSKISIFGYDGDLDWQVLSSGELMIPIPRKQDLPDEAAWGIVLKMQHLKNAKEAIGDLKEVVGRKRLLPRKEKVKEPWDRVVKVLKRA